MKHLMTATSIIALCAGTALAGDTTTVDFSDGSEGWVGPTGGGGSTSVVPAGGNSGAYMRTVFNDFGITFRNSTNAAFLGDYTTADSVTISMDIRVEFLNFFGQDVSRPWLLELRDFDTAQGGYPWTSVWFLFDNISAASNGEWSTYSVTFNPNAQAMPAGWAGYGDEDPNTFEPILPDGVTFQDVVSGVDQIAFTTLQPGFFFGFTDHTVGIDNLTITRSVPCAADLNGDGTLDFFDVSAFINAFSAMDPAADFTGEGSFDFFDVSAFINAFSAGCP